METSMNQILIYVALVACGALGWFARELYASVQSLRKDLSALQVQIGTDYVRYDRLQDALKPLLDAIKEVKEQVSQRIER